MIESIKLFYDDECGFCTKSVVFIIKYFKLPETILIKGSSDHKIKKIMEEENSWVLIDSKMKTWLRFSVFQQLISMSPRFQWASSFFSLRMISIIGNWIYLIVAKNRGKFSIFIK